MLVHICCSVDSHFFLQKLQQDYPQEKLIGFFYDPNIHPYSEYQLRFLDVKRSCKKLGIPLIEGDYDFENWIETVRGLEHAPEKGRRCEICFDNRFEVSAQKALELGEKKYTTTLLVSPKKSQEQLKRSGDSFFKTHGIEFIGVDYRSNGGTQDQIRVTKEEQLYRQDYCGCIYGLEKQRSHQNRLVDELFSPISNAILPASIEERLELYEERIELEEAKIKYRIVKEKFLNYRQLMCKLTVNKESQPIYALFYSTLPRKKAQGKIEYQNNDLYYFNREEIIFITLETYNRHLQTNYKSITELIYNPPYYKKEEYIREWLFKSTFNLSPLFVIEKVFDDKMVIELDAKSYEDTKERIVIVN